MKKAMPILTGFLFLLTILYPAGIIITAYWGYSFELVSISFFAILLAVLSIFIVALDHIFTNPFESKAMGFLSAILAPLSLTNAVFYIFECPQIWVIAAVLLSAFCCCYLAFEYGKPLLLKTISLVLSALMILFVVSCSYIALIFGNIRQDTVVETVESPSGNYYAQVIDSNQGALGGATVVNVYQKSGIDLFIFKIEREPQMVYFGDWGEFENMQIHWKNDDCLVINSVEYEIE